MTEAIHQPAIYLPKLVGNRELKMCGSKCRHYSPEEAAREARRMGQRYGMRFNGYHCPFCGFWHVGRAREVME